MASAVSAGRSSGTVGSGDTSAGPYRPGIGYLPGLDGLRALAVVAVLAYHGGVLGDGVGGWSLRGGYLGVEVFLVLSGYLITSLLVAERAATGTVRLGTFWWRRVRRLVPAVGVLLLVVTAVSVVVLPDTLAELRGDVLASLVYVQNWHHIVVGESYFTAVGRPPLLRHLWSLAVEMQFYLVWPVVFAVGIRYLGRRRLAVGVLAGALASTVLMAVLFSAGEDPTRVYFGTDTRAAGLLLGVAAALAWAPARLRSDVPARARTVLDASGAGALAVLALLMFGLGDTSPWLYRGGFLVTSLATVVVIVVVAHPAARLGTALGIPPLRWLGLRSYGIYLWHWPVFVLTRPDVDVTWPGWMVLAVRVGVTLGLAELSYRYVELPVRNGALAAWWQRVRSTRDHDNAFARRRLAIGATAVVVVTGLVVALLRAEPPPPPPWYVGEAAAVSTVEVTGTLALLPPALAAAIAEAQAASQTTVPEPPPGPVFVAGRVSAVGDSVMLGALDALGVAVPAEFVPDAAVSRQFTAGIDLLAFWRDTGYLGETVVVHLGNNGPITDEDADALFTVLADVPRVVIVTTHNEYAWMEGVNDVLTRAVERHANAVLVDWHAAAAPNGAWFWDDGMHLRPEGAAAYASVIVPAVSPTVSAK